MPSMHILFVFAPAGQYVGSIRRYKKRTVPHRGTTLVS